MERLKLRMRAAALLTLLSAPLLAAFVGSAPAAATPQLRDVDDFTFSSFTADYHLGRDAEGRSTLRTVETLVAEFPDRDQNRGIQRAIPEEYDGHPTDLQVVSVADENGTPRPYETESEDDLRLLTIAGDDYVRGTQTYVVTYEQRNVTRFFADTDADEFYWDVNGTGWQQPFRSVTARVHLDGDLAAALTGERACAVGAEGADASCETRVVTPADGGAVIEAHAVDVAPEETVTFAIGFTKGTFVPRDGSLLASGFAVPLLVGFAMAVLALAGSITALLTVARDAKGRPVIVPEYLPPAEPELPVIAAVLGKGGRTVAATLVSFAVRGIARIIDTGSGYVLEYRSAGRAVTARASGGLGPVEARIAGAFFGSVLTPGERAELGDVDENTGKSIQEAVTAGRARAKELGYFRPVRSGWIALVFALCAIAVVLLFIGAVGLLSDARGQLAALIGVVLIVVLIVAALLPLRTPLSASGAELRDHLRGMKDYLQLAEEDRLRMLQSEQGAKRQSAERQRGDGAADEGATREGRVVRLYERLLPYAVLLGVEGTWVEALAVSYERAGEAPDWYVGTAPFSATTFAAGVGAFSTTATSQYAGSTSSSSSGGSSGGISAGGGGGGGGGGV